jgi:carbamoyltransferase
MIIWGWTGMSHDASLAVFVDNKLRYARRTQQYTNVVNDKTLCLPLIADALQLGKPKQVYFYEQPWLKKTRQLWAGQYTLLGKESPTRYMRGLWKDAPKSTTVSHHLSHAAAGYYTSSFNDAAVLVMDSIGEWNTITIWEGRDGELTRKFSQNYPHSIGIWYSAMTQRVGLQPQTQEHIISEMALVGNSDRFYELIKSEFIKKMPSTSDPRLLFKRNCHRGCRDWRPELNTVQDLTDIAAATQRIFAEIVDSLVVCSLKLTRSKNIVLMGGCAMNSVCRESANKYFDKTWIIPSPGDASSALGCVLAHTKSKIKVRKTIWDM